MRGIGVALGWLALGLVLTIVLLPILVVVALVSIPFMVAGIFLYAIGDPRAEDVFRLALFVRLMDRPS